jgi:preprotein translocase subunit SecA
MVNRRNIDANLKPYKKILTNIKAKDMSALSDAEIKEAARSLRKRAQSGEPAGGLLPEAFAFVYEAAARTLGLTAFDVQLTAAAAMADGRIIEFPTGEGKTLAAVFVAFLGALSGKGVHVLTFNDYLAKRDAEWMGPVYDFLNVSVSCINEEMDAWERKKAYAADVTYVTAKEAGFDYLRGFLACDEAEVAQRPFHLAIIDEADSILIDEARVPLVIAGDMPATVEIDRKIFQAVLSLNKDIHYEMDEFADNIYLTDAGAEFIEKRLGLANLYDAENIGALTRVNLIMQAEYLLKKDVDYIVRDGGVLLVDEYTGRVMHNRQWPDGLQAAVEIKEGLIPKTQGVVMNRITLQNFLQFYPNLCGMTGTACASAPEFFEFYDKTVTPIPPNKPCRRVDQPDVIYASKEDKYAAVAEEIGKVHAAGRPVLVGTASIEESEKIAEMLRGSIGSVSVLNAKNDAEEAKIIARAGRLNAVTISTNMAGRGVDIRLGGDSAEEYGKVCALGGLYVIGTNRHESVRIDNQLRGRAGRQGDPGESRFFISLEDDLIVKFRVDEQLPEQFRELGHKGPIGIPTVNKAVVRTQRMVEGRTLDAKITLAKYAALPEDQRKIVHEKRRKILSGEDELSVLEQKNPERYRSILSQVSAEEFLRAQREIELYAINRCWADHLLYMECAQDEVQMVSSAGKDPLSNYNRKLIGAFGELEDNIANIILDIWDTAVIRDGRIDLDAMGVRGPSSTRTYMVHDGTEQIKLHEMAASMINLPLYLLYLLAVQRKRKKRDNN